MNVALNLTLHKNQEVIHRSPAKYIVVKSGKRFGKTELALFKLIKWAGARPGGTFWYLTDTARHAEEIGWKRLLQLLPTNLIKNINNNKLLITTVIGSTIKMMSADNPDYLRGTKIHGIVWEEAAYIKNGKEIWDGIIYGQLAGVGEEEGGPSFFISSPNRDGTNWYSNFYQEAVRKKQLGDKDWDAFHFTAWDNPLYKREVIQAWKDNCTEDTWEVEYMANESAHAGQIISEFNYSLHVKQFENPVDAFFCRGIDWGIAHPTGCLWLYVDLKKNMISISDEYKKSGKTIEESCGIVKLITGGRKVDWTVIDPSMAKRDKYVVGKREMDEFMRYGVPCIPGDNRDRGYDVMKMFFKKNMIQIHPKCKDLIFEVKTVQWGDETGEDLMDCLRYALLRIHDVYFGGNLGFGNEEKEFERNPGRYNFNDPLLFPKRGRKNDFGWATGDLGDEQTEYQEAV